MASTRWPQVVDAIVDLTRALPGWWGPGQDPPQVDAPGLDGPVLVLDGPELALTGERSARLLVVGMTLDDDLDQGTSGQVIVALGRHQREERGSVRCQAIAQHDGLDLPEPDWSGPRVTARDLRRSAFGVMAAVETLLRADVTLGFEASAVVVAEIGERIVPRQGFGEQGGALCAVEFDVIYRTRI